ncbi:hypothetical protein GTH32_02460 [Alteromonas sp. 345S023]|uniref:Lipoprotein n=1 Tax=Alteromonas profundi TaxID=2696062 RepID=A0A7X5LJW2_9ALTE|nr:hypothetical protein [Alteromonas profundi]NDV90055.1 hypothetical protein [Alteromonas profundi]
MKYCILFSVVAVLSACGNDNAVATAHASTNEGRSATLVFNGEGYTSPLHEANMQAWQKASFQAKREACSEVILALYTHGKLPLNELNDVQLKLLSETLVQQLNTRAEMAAMAHRKKKDYENETVATAILGIIEDRRWLVRS